MLPFKYWTNIKKGCCLNNYTFWERFIYKLNILSSTADVDQSKPKVKIFYLKNASCPALFKCLYMTLI